jgi:hypothetical protein
MIDGGGPARKKKCPSTKHTTVLTQCSSLAYREEEKFAVFSPLQEESNFKEVALSFTWFTLDLVRSVSAVKARAVAL